MLFGGLPAAKTQTITGGIAANFGIDADAYSSNLEFLTPQPPASSTHDWFVKPAFTGFGVIDTTGSSAIKTRLQSNGEYAFTAGMNYPRFSVQDNYLFLDSRYARDYASFSAGAGDSTAFRNSSSKNGQSPLNWSTDPTGTGVLDKDDIIDMYVHMRRDGTVVNNTDPSHLILIMGATTLSSNGNHYMDFELYRSRIIYNTSTGLFENSGPANTGGHSAWKFNATGTITSMGDLTASFSFSSATVTDIGIWIWVSNVDFQNMVPQKFDFAGEFYGDGPGASWGYAKIKPKGAQVMNVWGIVNSTGVTMAAPWGTASKDLGSNSNDYYSENYGKGQFAEVGIDFTSLGIDPGFNLGGNPCNPPFTRVFVKTRTSTSFTSELKDFTGPYPFLDAPQTPANILTPQRLTCNTTSVTLQPASIQSGGSYIWSTANGNIVTKLDSVKIIVNQPGTYYLSAAPYAGCSANYDSIQVNKDIFKPVASASVSGNLLNSTLSTITLFGGDPVASNYSTPYGGSLGLLYNWNGPIGYNAAVQNPLTSDTGNYRIIVTEIRNGCKDTAFIKISRTFIILPLKLISFDAHLLNNTSAEIKWTVQQEEGNEHYILQRSQDGITFTDIDLKNVATASQQKTYSFIDNFLRSGTDKYFYRLKIVAASGAVNYSNISKVLLKQVQGTGIIKAFFSADGSGMNILFNTPVASDYILRIISSDGKVLYSKQTKAIEGLNSVVVPFETLPKTVKIIQLIINNEVLVNKLL